MYFQVFLEVVEDGFYVYCRFRFYLQFGIGYQLGIGYEYDLIFCFSINGVYICLQCVGGFWEDGVLVNVNFLSVGLKYCF